jgi:CDP-diacylglycerol--glycerol-3-phosphate 3-phosphatidyltransferase
VVDLALSLVVLALVALVAGAYVIRVATRGTTSSERAEREGTSALLPKGPIKMLYWAIGPLSRGCVAAGVGANAISWASLVAGVGAGAAACTGHFGGAAALALVSALGDALDGEVARASKSASSGGEVLDAAIDRYVEFAILGGVAVEFRESLPRLTLALLALLASYMVSYSSAKAEALHVAAPRGAMRRAERAIYVLAGLALSPLVAHFAPGPWADAPLLAALALVGTVGNVSAVRRLRAVARSVYEANAPHPAPLAGPSVTFLKHQAGASLATVVDFSTMIALVHLLRVSPVLATAVGAACGGVSNFVAGRIWIFHARNGAAPAQAARYAAVALAGLGWNTLGEYVVNVLLGVQYVVARVCVAIAVSFFWNFPMQRGFVFRVRTEAP